jgi:hypothetical protein
MGTEPLPPGVYPIAVDTYISYHIIFLSFVTNGYAYLNAVHKFNVRIDILGSTPRQFHADPLFMWSILLQSVNILFNYRSSKMKSKIFG